jgi:Flp pilus assembly pilin Flp
VIGRAQREKTAERGCYGRSSNQGEHIMTFLRNLWNDEQGQDLIEYTLLMAFVALASAALFLGAGGSIKGIWSVTNSQLAQANTSAS